MANNTIRTIKLGAPTSIEGGASPNCELSVQVASLLHDVSLSDRDGKCTNKGSFLMLSNLLNQVMEEHSIQNNTWQNVSIVYGDGLDTFVRNGGTISLYLTENGEIIPNSNACWNVYIIEGETGANAIVSKDGVLSTTSNKNLIGIVEAINFCNNTEKALILFAQLNGLASCISNYPSIANLLAGKKEIINTVIDYPLLAKRASRQNDYVKDGLVLMWNPLTANSQEWKTWDSQWIYKNNGKVIISDSGIPYFPTSAAYNGTTGLSNQIYNTFTIEIVIKDKSTNGNNRVYYGSSGSLCMGTLSGDRGYLNSTANTVAFPIKNDGLRHTVSIANNVCYVDGAKINSGGTNNWGNAANAKFFIGAGASNYNNFIGYIYEIRIYNRLLTSNEILHNQEIDMDVYEGL